MNKKPLSHEMLKLVACMTMLVDHLGAVFFPSPVFRIIGRVAFPIYAFLLCEGAEHTRSPEKYLGRLALGALLAELPFDFLFFGGFTWEHQSVMVTLLLGSCMIFLGRKISLLAAFPLFFLAADFLRTDYGGWGIALIALFAATAQGKGGWILQTAGMCAIFLGMNTYRVNVLGLGIPVQCFGVLAMIPILLYSGRKLTRNRAVQWLFYLFYPVHMLILWLFAML